jgi:HD-GYP domain-containing protein (c-di-GMP phosphodiesterase class II)
MDTRAPLIFGLLTGGAFVYRGRESQRAVERIAAASLETLLNAIEANDENTGMHVRRVAAAALIIADAAELDERQQRAVERVALFHDIGKIHQALFDIVHERKSLTPDERRAIATHPQRGAEVLDPLGAFYPELPRGVLAHHEWWNGKGYPHGLKGRRIPIEARITAIADTFDAITHSRRYRPRSSVATAAAVLADGRGTQFDPELIDLVLLPPVLDEISRVRLVVGPQRRARRGRRPENSPDVSFRWRSESLSSRRVDAAREID